MTTMKDWEVTDLMKRIYEGDLDHHLREIATALFLRKDKLRGTSSFTEQASEYVAELNAVYQKQEAMSKLTPYSIHPASYRVTNATFTYDGRHYYKSDVVGKVFVPDHSCGIDEIVGAEMRVQEVRQSRIVVVSVQSYYVYTRRRSVQKALQNRTGISVPMSVLSPYLAR